MAKTSEPKSYPLYIRNSSGDLVSADGQTIQKRNLGADSGKYYFDIVVGGLPVSGRIEGNSESAAKAAAQVVMDALAEKLRASKVNDGIVIVDIRSL